MVAETTYSNNNGFGRFFILLILAGLIFGGILFAINSDLSVHALEKHGNDYIKVKQCMENRGPEFTLHNPETNRSAHCVFLDDIGRFGLLIKDENGKDVTGFIKEKMSRIEQILNYLENVGYK